MVWCGVEQVLAQEIAPNAPKSPVVFSLDNSVAVNGVSVSGTISGKKVLVHLWGLQDAGSGSDNFSQKSLQVLQNAIGSAPLSCEYRGQGSKPSEILAQCDNNNRQDLGMYMLQEGYALVDRAAVGGTIFEQPYQSAQDRAKEWGMGVWETEKSTRNNSSSQQDSPMLIYINIFILVAVLLSFFALAGIVLQGFHKIMKTQSVHMDMLFREQKMQEKEREVIAAMIDSELKANKSKIDAYIVVYEETLSELKNTQRTPRYQKLGDIIQKQPALSRGIFDKNSDKLHILGKKLSSELIHFYARIKTNPDYENVEPDMEVSQVVRIVEEALEQGRRLNNLAEFLIKEIEDGNFEQTEE